MGVERVEADVRPFVGAVAVFRNADPGRAGRSILSASRRAEGGGKPGGSGRKQQCPSIDPGAGDGVHIVYPFVAVPGGNVRGTSLSIGALCRLVIVAGNE